MWLTNLTADLKRQADDTILILTRQRVHSAAAACRATYDVDSRYFEYLITCDEDIEIFIHSAIQIQDNISTNGIYDDLFLVRDRRMSRRLAPRICGQINKSRVGLDNAILRVWTDYERHRGSDWKSLPAPNERWLASNLSVHSQSTIHYNLLDGTLLIDGKPLGRLPSSIIRHRTYIRLLGRVSAHSGRH